MRVPAAVVAHGPVHQVLHRAGPPLARGLPVPFRDPAAPARRRVASQFLSPVPGRLIGPFLGNSTTSPRAGATTRNRPDCNRAEMIRTTATTLTIRSANNRGNERRATVSSDSACAPRPHSLRLMDRVRGDQAMATQRSRQPPDERGEHGPVCPSPGGVSGSCGGVRRPRAVDEQLDVLDGGRATSSPSSPSTCWKIKYNSRSDTTEIMPNRWRFINRCWSAAGAALRNPTPLAPAPEPRRAQARRPTAAPSLSVRCGQQAQDSAGARHRRVDAPPARHGRGAGPVAEVQGDQVEIPQRPAEMRRRPPRRRMRATCRGSRSGGCHDRSVTSPGSAYR